jgi:hypothetical protein
MSDPAGDYDIGAVAIHYGAARAGFSAEQVQAAVNANPALVERIGRQLRPALESAAAEVAKIVREMVP